jgi:hypothetical protein
VKRHFRRTVLRFLSWWHGTSPGNWPKGTPKRWIRDWDRIAQGPHFRRDCEDCGQPMSFHEIVHVVEGDLSYDYEECPRVESVRK